MQMSPSFRLVELARQAKRLPHGAAAILLAPAILVGGALVGLLSYYFLTLFIHPSGPAQSAWSYSLQLATSYLGILLVTGLWVWRYEQRPLWTLGFERQAALPRYLAGMLAGIGLVAIWVGGMWLSGGVSIQGGLTGQVTLAGMGVMLVGWIIQGGVEEIVFRGWLLNVLAARHNLKIAVVVSSVLFGLLHALNPGFTALALFNLCLFGLFAALWALREGSLWGICGLHAAWNWAEGNLFGLDVSGIETAGGMLINFDQAGPGWLNGGAFGPEGGLGMTILLLAGIAVLSFLLVKKSPGRALPG